VVNLLLATEMEAFGTGANPRQPISISVAVADFTTIRNSM